MNYFKILPIALLVLFTQCKTKKAGSAETAAYMPGDKELAIAQKTWPGTTIEELKEGNSIYRNECTQCHKNFDIVKFSEKKWKHEIDEMSPKAKLSAAQKQKLSKFILSYRESNAATK